MDLFSSTHTLAPPTQEDELVAWLRLIRSPRIGPGNFFRLSREEGGVAGALAALPDRAVRAQVKGYRPCPEPVARAELAAGRAAGARLIAFGAPDYPPALTQIPDPPPVLWARGDIGLLRKPGIALVGARNASSLGARMARKLAQDIGAAGFTVVSGLARGIDAAGHDAALDTGTVAVLAGGIDVIYPAENTVLADKIAKQGCLITEQPPGLQPFARHFPRRNRIISGMAQALVVVEAAAKSGSLITARNALDQGREVFAVPGHPFDARASGCNMLIRDGATLIRGAADILETVAPVRKPNPEPQAATPVDAAHAGGPADIRAAILGRLGPSPVAEDQLIRDLNLPVSVVAPELTTLELDGEIARAAGGLLMRA